jgi:hypothetical protein
MVTHWLFDVVQPEHLRYIKSISWEGDADQTGNYSNFQDHPFVQMSSIIMLMQLGFLGHCKIRLITDPLGGIHFACILREKILNLIQRKDLTTVHAEDENSILDEFDVIGLLYAVAIKLSDFCKQVHYEQFWLRNLSGINLDSI